MQAHRLNCTSYLANASERLQLNFRRSQKGSAIFLVLTSASSDDCSRPACCMVYVNELLQLSAAHPVNLQRASSFFTSLSTDEILNGFFRWHLVCVEPVVKTVNRTYEYASSVAMQSVSKFKSVQLQLTSKADIGAVTI